jgi:hypothetical protein
MTNFLTKLTTSIEPLIGAESLPSADSTPHQFLEERARLRVERREIQRQENIERIVALVAAEVPGEVSEEAVSRDWLIQFFDFAQDVSDESLQQFWARVLATYIANPDAIFKRTLAQLRNMDRWELDAFIEYCAFSFALESGWRFMFEENLTRQEIWGYVRGNDYTQHFINIGLLSPETAIMRPAVSKGLRIRYFEKEYELAAPSKAEGDNAQIPDPCVSYRKFTPAGQQLAKAVRTKTYYGYARNLIKALDSERNIHLNLVEAAEAAAS